MGRGIIGDYRWLFCGSKVISHGATDARFALCRRTPR
jgi:hypothetical protein